MVSSQMSREVEAADDGKFEFFQPDPGEYVILVLQPGRLLGAQRLVISLPTPPSVEINVAASTP